MLIKTTYYQSRFFIGVLLCLISFFTGITLGQQKPNIIYILADDLGYGDISCLNAASKIQTPNIDKLVFGGMSRITCSSDNRW